MFLADKPSLPQVTDEVRHEQRIALGPPLDERD
jgi:hypothetical protein